MISLDQISANKDEYIELLRSIHREGMDTEGLIAHLESGDFFTAPASTKYHNAFSGGVCDHSLNVYYNLMHLVKYKFPNNCPISEDSIKIVALCHDISKEQYYKMGSRNVKVYSETGKLSDNLGRFDWQSVSEWKTREPSERLIFGSHENTSEYLTRQYIPLTMEESIAIQHHMGGMSWDSAQDNIGEIYNRYPLAALLYMADMLSSYIDERESTNE